MENKDFTEIDASSEDAIKKIAGLSENGFSAENGGFYKILVPYSAVSFGGEKYNESYLAALRDALKGLESCAAQFIIAPIAQKPLSSIDEALELTAAFKHCARRIKDCTNVIGFGIPAAFAGMERAAELEENFKSELLEKHPHYVFLK